MKNKLLLALCLISICVNVNSINAEPLKVEEKKNDNKTLNFNPLYASIPGNFEIVTKKVDGSFIIFYLSDSDSVLTISESYYSGQELHQSDSTELIKKNGVKYLYSPFKNNSGGMLVWIKNNILFEMSSIQFDKNTLIHYANTVQ